MDFTGALRERLLAAPAFTSLAGSRASWVERPQGKPLPALTLQIISDPRPQHLKGFDTLRQTRVQADCWGTTHMEARRLGEAVIAVLAPAETSNGIIFNRAIIDNFRTLGDGSGEQITHRTTIDLLFWWQAQ